MTDETSTVVGHCEIRDPAPNQKVELSTRAGELDRLLLSVTATPGRYELRRIEEGQEDE